MSEYREANLEELTFLLDWLAREYGTTNDECRRDCRQNFGTDGAYLNSQMSTPAGSFYD